MVSTPTSYARPRSAWSAKPRSTGPGTCASWGVGSSTSSITKLTTRTFGDGTSQVIWRGADAVKDRLLTYLSSIANPRRPDGSDAANPDDRRPYTQKLGHAFATLLENYDPERLPLHGGDATTVLVRTRPTSPSGSRPRESP